MNSKCSKMLGEGGLSVWGCLECAYQSQNRHNVLAHIEVHHITHGGHKCQLCANISPTRNALRMHMKRKHGDVATTVEPY